MIDIKNLTYKIKDKTILDNISCEIHENRITGIVGKNGVGKSTLIRHLTREIKTKNKIFLDDIDISSINTKNYAKKIAFVFQTFSYVGDFTVREIINLGRYPYKKLFHDYTENDEKIVDKYIKFLNLEKIENQKAKNISGGELKLTMIARALAQETPYIIMDEPINHLDINYAYKFMKYLKKIKNKTIILTIHDIEMALNYCDDIIIMNDSKILDFGKAHEILIEENIYKAFNVKNKIKNIENKKIILFY